MDGKYHLRTQRVISMSTLEIWVKEGHPRSLKMTPFNRRNTTMVMFLISDSVIESPKIKSFPYRVWDLNFSNLLFTFTFFARSQNFWGQVVINVVKVVIIGRHVVLYGDQPPPPPGQNL